MKKKYYLIVIGLALVLSVHAVQSTGIFVRFAGSDTVYKAYQAVQQFFDDGGQQDFSNVQLIEPQIGSVAVSNDYNATTTGNIASSTLLKKGTGSLGSFIVTLAGSAGGRTIFYDATTTNALARTGQPATSTIIIASIPSNIVAGTYVFDVAFSRGLLMESSISVGTSTVTFR